ncbi:MAG: Holliday junction resolvase RuvX [Bacteroidota bacterium]
MGRIIALDYGKKRIGIAVTDSLQLIATPLTTVHTPEVLHFLQQYTQKEIVESLVVGLPRNLNGTPSAMTEVVAKFVKMLAKNFPQQHIFEYDERYSSKIAQASLLQGGFSRKDKHNKGNVDKLSAAIILQSFLTAQPECHL